MGSLLLLCATSGPISKAEGASRYEALSVLSRRRIETL